jgi:hypothetical protein
MYQTELRACHLDVLEHTIGRFYSRGVAILDPVLNHLIGTYSFRCLKDHKNLKPPEKSGDEPPEETDNVNRESARQNDDSDEESASGSSETDYSFDFKVAERGYINYVDIPAHRTRFPDDTYLLPPELPVIGHSIRHWSGVRLNGSTAAAYTGFPLNIGKNKKFVRTDATAAIDANDYSEEETNRLVSHEYFRNHGPGEVHQ